MASAKDEKMTIPPPDGDCGFDSDDEDVDSPHTKELEKLMERLDLLAASVPPSVILKHLDQATTELERKARPPPSSSSSSLPIPLAPPLLIRQSAHSAPPPNMALHCAQPPRQAPAKLAPASAPPPPAPTPMDTK